MPGEVEPWSCPSLPGLVRLIQGCAACPGLSGVVRELKVFFWKTLIEFYLVQRCMGEGVEPASPSLEG